MTVNAETAKSGPYTGNGSTTVHAYAFKVLDQDHIVVTQTVIATGVETVLTISTHYSVSGVGTDGGGNITMVTAAPSTDTVTITRAVPQTQTTDLVNRGAVQPSVIETMGDRGVQMVQDFDETISRTLKLPVSTAAGISTELPAPVADAFIKWNSDADALESTTTSVGQTLAGDGTVSLPYYSFAADPNSGMYRIGADNVGFAMGGSKVVDIVTAGLNVTGTTTSSGILSIDDTTDTSSGTTGSIHTDGGVGIAKKLHVIGTTTHGGNVVSDTDSTDDLGTTGVRWANLFVDDITVTTAVTAAGVITGATVEATGDTSASDNAAMGYTAGEGLILTGQGSSTDVTIKNDADAAVISVPTGTTNTTFGGNIVSDTDSTDDIGTTGVRWKELFVDDITMGGDQTIGGNLTVTGDLTINGTTVTNDATNVTVKDFLIEINSGASTNANDMGIIMERGSTGDNAVILWDESGDYFQVGTTTATGGSSGNLTVADGQLHAEGLVLSGTSSDLGTVTTLDIDGGTVDGAVIGGAAAAAGTFTDLASTGDTTIGNATGDALTINPSAWTLANAVTITGTWTNLGTVTTADINGGTVDGAVIGGASAAAVTGTTVTGVSLVASQDLALATGATVTGIDDGVISTGSATLLATQGAIDTAINSSSKAPGISMTWETTTTDTDQGVGKVWANHGTLSSATVLYFDDVERNSVSINALIDSLDDPTASNSATIYIQEAGTATAGVVFKVSGSVTSASTYSRVAVTHVATFGTLSDGDVVGVTFAFSGDDGTGTGDLLAANNLSDVDSASTSLSNLGGVGLGLVLALG